jgi:hypothetical protein
MCKGIKHKVLNVARDKERDSEQGSKLPLSFTQKISVAPPPKTVYSNMHQTSYRRFMRQSTSSRQSGRHNILRYWENLVYAHSSLIGPFSYLKEKISWYDCHAVSVIVYDFHLQRLNQISDLQQNWSERGTTVGQVANVKRIGLYKAQRHAGIRMGKQRYCSTHP